MRASFVALTVGLVGSGVVLGVIAMAIGVGRTLPLPIENKSATSSPQAHRLYGLLLMDDAPDPGREGLSSAVMQLRVEHSEVIASPKTSAPGQAGKTYTPLTWRVIEDGYQGAYGVRGALRKSLNTRVQLTGVVYNRCGGGLYLRSEHDTEAGCLVPDAPTQIELVDERRRPLKTLPLK